jgi:hypothetical protein
MAISKIKKQFSAPPPLGRPGVELYQKSIARINLK